MSGWFGTSVVTATITVAVCGAAPETSRQDNQSDRRSPQIRVATFNTSLNRRNTGQLVNDLRAGDPQAKKVAAILRTLRPDILLLNEFDFDESGEAVRLFQDHYLQATDGLGDPLELPHTWTAPVNTGVPSERDLDHDGRTNGPGDAFGFGYFPGQYGMVVLSRYPIRDSEMRSFRMLLWKNMPQPREPRHPDTEAPWYSRNEWDIMRLSSRTHWDCPIEVEGTVIHVLASHPTPPAFDGPEDRNGCRNADEIRFWADYLSPSDSGWIRDDSGTPGGLTEDARFVILGDLNADPFDGGSASGAVQQLLDHPRVQSSQIPISQGAELATAQQGGKNKQHRGPAAHDTSDFSDASVGNLRVDYVLPSLSFAVESSGVFWPAPGEPGRNLVDCSDHRAVWTDLRIRG